MPLRPVTSVKMSTRRMANGAMHISALAHCTMALLGLVALPATASAEDAFSAEIDLLEVHVGKGDDHLVLDSTFTLGGDADQFVVKLEGGSDTRTSFDDVEVQALYSRTFSEAFTILAGVRHDIREASDLTHASFGIASELAPWIEAEHFTFLSQHGDLTGSGQLTGSWDLAPRLALEPRLALGWSAQDVAAEDLAGGLTDIEASVRLRRSLGKNANVYGGVIHERLLGGTRDIAVAGGDPARVTRAILGVGFSF